MFADLKMIRTFAPLSTESTSDKGSFGEVAEWSIAAVLKTVVPRGTRGSNPCLSAEIRYKTNKEDVLQKASSLFVLLHSWDNYLLF